MRGPVGLTLLVLGALLIFLIGSVWNQPKVCHLLHLAFPPDDLLEPVLLVQNVAGATRQEQEFSFTPKYCELYEIGFLAGSTPIPKSYRPSARVRAEITFRGEVVAEIDETSPKRVVYVGKGEGIQKIAYGIFELSSSREAAKIKLQISPVEGSQDDRLSSLDFFVGVTGSP